MKKISILFILAFLSCKSGPEQLNVDLTFASSVTQNMQNSIDQFVFLIGEAGVSQRLIFPATCLGCSSNDATCPAANVCLESDCGFAASSATFEPEIDFTQIGEGETLSIIACALDGNSAAVAGGSGTVVNRAGEQASISLTATVTSCNDELPPVCP
jgi:hypothetical protein